MKANSFAVILESDYPADRKFTAIIVISRENEEYGECSAKGHDHQ